MKVLFVRKTICLSLATVFLSAAMAGCKTEQSSDSENKGLLTEVVAKLRGEQLTELDRMYGRALPPAYDKAWEYIDEKGFEAHDPTRTFENPTRKLNNRISELIDPENKVTWGTVPDPGKKLIWVVLEDATLVVGEEVLMGTPDSQTHWYVPVNKDKISARGEKLTVREYTDPGSEEKGKKTRLGHPSLTVGKNCRIAGEVVWLPDPNDPENKEKVTGPYINNESGRCSIHHDRDEDALLNAAGLFMENGVQVKVKYKGLIRFGNALPQWLKDLVKKYKK